MTVLVLIEQSMFLMFYGKNVDVEKILGETWIIFVVRLKKKLLVTTTEISSVRFSHVIVLTVSYVSQKKKLSKCAWTSLIDSQLLFLVWWLMTAIWNVVQTSTSWPKNTV